MVRDAMGAPPVHGVHPSEVEPLRPGHRASVDVHALPENYRNNGLLRYGMVI